jgi:hypothetical protein
MTLMRIRLELARTPEFPSGSPEHGYEFQAPLDANGHIDANAWKIWKTACAVTRFWGAQPVQNGMLRHVGSGWRFDYDRGDDRDDEPFFKLDRHSLLPGNYVSITEQDGLQRPFRVVSVVPALQPAAAS